jgi:hypothetical protein
VRHISMAQEKKEKDAMKMRHNRKLCKHAALLKHHRQQ